MAAYTTRLRPDYSAGRVEVPDVGGIFLDFADRQAKQYQIGLENEMKQAQMAEDRKRYETELGFKQRHEQRLVDELGREQATREAVMASLDPDRFKASKMSEIDAAIAQGMANLSPQERAEAEAQVKANWDRAGSGNYALGLARDSTLADPSKVLNAQKSRLDIALSDPNSLEFKALQKAELDNHAKKLAAGWKFKQKELDQSKAEKKQELTDAIKLLDVSTTFDTVTDNSLAIANANKRNQALADKQELYGSTFSDVAISIPQREGQSDEDYFKVLDAETKRTIGMLPTSNIRNYALGNVPTLESKTISRPKTQEEYAKDIYSKLRSITPSESSIKVGQGLIESYAKNGELLKTLKEEKATVADLKNVYSALGGDSTKVDTKKGLEAGIKSREAILKAESKKTTDKTKDSAYSGLITAMDEESVDNYKLGASKTDQRKILDVVKQYKVPEKDAIAILRNVDAIGKPSSSVAASFEDYVKANYGK